MKNKILIGFITTLMVSFSGWVHSDTTEDLINALIVKGVLTEQEGNLLAKQAKAEKKNKRQTLDQQLKEAKMKRMPGRMWHIARHIGNRGRGPKKRTTSRLAGEEPKSLCQKKREYIRELRGSLLFWQMFFVFSR